jgi:hypothetical protein
VIFSHVLYQLSYLAREAETISPSLREGQSSRGSGAAFHERAGYPVTIAALTSVEAGRILRARGNKHVTSPRDRQANCGFCEGTGLWADAASDASAADPCPLCDGSGIQPGAVAPADEPQASPTLTLERVLAGLPEMSPQDRQRLYEDLHALYDCRIYRR